ncbi:HlyD family secretion protein [Pendulispora brunnea]|uniref:HlyD family secretion protein n=1 Tax=Pendulispora brunnea TaxID=2905690 RepID=A0ABZ2K8W5_9BACT
MYRVLHPVLSAIGMFNRTFQTLDSETDGRSCWLLVLSGALLLAWLYWLTRVPVTVFEASTSARLEVASASYDVDAPVGGRVVSAANVVLGRTVAEGEVILEVDSEMVRLQLAEAKAKEAACVPQLEAAARELEAEIRALATENGTDFWQVEEARNRHHESIVAATLAAREADRVRKLYATKSISEAEYQRGTAEAEQREAAALAIAAESKKLSGRASTDKSERESRIAVIQRTQATLRGELTLQQARVRTLEHDLAQRQVRAPAAGTISAIGQTRIGAVLKEGDRLVTILAGDGLRVVAEYPPAAVFGRVHVGQSARIRFDGFPWIEYGIPYATVSRVARETREGRARVELVVDEATARRIPLQHGQPAEVTIAVDSKTPWRLLLQTIGKSVASDDAASLRAR